MKYKINGNQICFYSYPEYYSKEQSGIKNNTVRLNPTANQINDIFDWWNTIGTKYIKIVNSGTHESFCRKLSDVTEYMHLIVFTWEIC